MTLTTQNIVTISSETDIINARRMARNAANAMGFGMTDVTRIITAVSELARNIYKFAGSGKMIWMKVNSENKVGLKLIFKDNGPGIQDIELAMQEGYSTGNGLGMGLPGSKRLMDEMEIDSKVGKGTQVIIIKWLK